MKDIIARLADVAADLNGVMNQVSDNDEVEFDIDKRLDVLEVVVDDLSTDVNNIVEFANETSEG